MENVIDELGLIKAQIAELRELEKALVSKVKGAIFDSGEPALEGDLYRAALVMTERKTVNWEKIARDLGASDRKIAANTKVSGYSQLRMSTRRGAEKVAA